MTTPNIRKVALAAILAGGASLAIAGPALANPPDQGQDIAGKTVYLQAGSWLHYNDAEVSRVYTTTKAVLKLEGAGVCAKRLCPVMHNHMKLWGERTRIDLDAPASGTTIETERTLRQGDEGDDV